MRRWRLKLLLTMTTLIVKVMAGLAAGRWVLTRRYVDKCARRGAWLPSPALFITSEAVVRHRRVWHQVSVCCVYIDAISCFISCVSTGPELPCSRGCAPRC